MKTALLITTFILMLGGCTSIPTSMDSAPVPEERVLLKTKTPKDNAAEIIIIRDRSFAGGACYYAIYIDDQLAARIGPSEKAAFKRNYSFKGVVRLFFES